MPEQPSKAKTSKAASQHVTGWIGEYCPILAGIPEAHPMVPSLGEACPACLSWAAVEGRLGIKVPLPKFRPDLSVADIHTVDYLLAGRRILAVEDVKTNMVMLERILAPLGDAFIPVGNGRMALSTCQKRNDLGLILLDLVMPEMDGFAFLEQLSALHPIETRSFAVLIISKLDDWQSTKKAIALGAGGYLNKPYSKENLLLGMARVLQAHTSPH